MTAPQSMTKKPKTGLVPNLRFPEFQDGPGWATKPGDKLFDQISNRQAPAGLPILAITQEYGAIPRDDIDYHVSVTDKSVETYKEVCPGDFIISLRSFQGGIEYSDYHGICSPAYVILRKRVELSDLFFKQHFKSHKFIQQLTKNLEGLRDGKMVSYKQFSELLLLNPSPAEQHKIASCLSSLDDLIAAERQKLDALKAHKHGLLQYLFPREGETLPRLRFPEFQDAPAWEDTILRSVLTEHGEKNDGSSEVHSVSVHKGVINQIEHLGRSFAAADRSNYNLAKPHDIIYTKSPTGDFPWGVVKQNRLPYNVIVSPLYGVFSPVNRYLGYILDAYFESPIRTTNYLAPITQKGAKNTIQISNATFLSKGLCLPSSEAEHEKIASCLSALDDLIAAQGNKLVAVTTHKKGLMQQLFPSAEEIQ